MATTDESSPRARFAPWMRLRRKRDFERVFRRGNRARGRLMTVAVAPNGLPHARLGLSVGKLSWKRAVDRNRMRRIFREAFRLERERLPAGIDVVVIGARGGVRAELDEARAELPRLCAKALRRYREAHPDEDAGGGRDGAADREEPA